MPRSKTRKDFTPSERVAIGNALEARLGERRGGANPQNFGELRGRESAEVAAEKADFGNPETYPHAKQIRDKARALEVYAQQAMDSESERWVHEIRMRAERRAGELLKETKASGERTKPADTLRQGPLSRRATTGKTLTDLGISRDQSSRWQQLAEVPDEHPPLTLRTSRTPAVGRALTAARR